MLHCNFGGRFYRHLLPLAQIVSPATRPPSVLRWTLLRGRLLILFFGAKKRIKNQPAAFGAEVGEGKTRN